MFRRRHADTSYVIICITPKYLSVVTETEDVVRGKQESVATIYHEAIMTVHGEIDAAHVMWRVHCTNDKTHGA